jgi:hypothetical protein
MFTVAKMDVTKRIVAEATGNRIYRPEQMSKAGTISRDEIRCRCQIVSPLEFHICMSLLYRARALVFGVIFLHDYFCVHDHQYS